MHVAVEKRADIFIRRGNIMLLQYADDDTRIGHPGDFNAAQVVGNFEALPERGFERLQAGPARMDQRAINVEKEEPLLRFCHVEG